MAVAGTWFAFAMLAATAAATHAGDLPASGELGCEESARAACDFFDPASGLRIKVPADWPMRRLRLTTETGPAAGSHERFAERWVSIDYLPEEPANPESSLLQAAVLPWFTWQRLSAQTIALPGVEVAASRTRVVVAETARSNPYPPDSRDAQIFDALMPSLEEVSLILTLRSGR
jgi:hypothetical protein